MRKKDRHPVERPDRSDDTLRSFLRRHRPPEDSASKQRTDWNGVVARIREQESGSRSRWTWPPLFGMPAIAAVAIGVIAVVILLRPPAAISPQERQEEIAVLLDDAYEYLESDTEYSSDLIEQIEHLSLLE